MNNSLLSIQGPPGTGKSYTASNMIVRLIQANKKIGVTALSHKVITGLLEKIQLEADKIGLRINMIQKVFYGSVNAATAEVKDISWNEKIVLLLIVGIIFFIGVYPQPLIDLTSGGINDLLLRIK